MYQLPRRPFLGLEVRRDPVKGALVVTAVLENGPAALAGLCVGDVLCALDGRELAYPADVRPRGEEAVFTLVRAAEPLTIRVRVAPMPLERFGAGEVRLGEVRVGEHRLRTIYTIPDVPARGAVLYLQGIDTLSCEHPLEPTHPLARLVEGWTRAGFVTLRVDRSGVGDSEGPPPAETGLKAEIEAYTAALDALYAEFDHVFLFGHSLGGMIAPLLARRAAGVIVFGTTARRWRDVIVDTTERQLRLAGHTGEALAERLAGWAEVHARVLRDGWTPAEVFARSPHLAYLESRECHGESIFGRHVSLFRELSAHDLASAWRAVEAPVLVLHGEYDWVCSAEESRAITAPRGAFVELPAIGHDMLAHASLEASFRRPSEGRWDGQVLDASLAWVRGSSSG